MLLLLYSIIICVFYTTIGPNGLFFFSVAEIVYFSIASDGLQQLHR